MAAAQRSRNLSLADARHRRDEASAHRTHPAFARRAPVWGTAAAITRPGDPAPRRRPRAPAGARPGAGGGTPLGAAEPERAQGRRTVRPVAATVVDAPTSVVTFRHGPQALPGDPAPGLRALPLVVARLDEDVSGLEFTPCREEQSPPTSAAPGDAPLPRARRL